jgi:hypothetical protein
MDVRAVLKVAALEQLVPMTITTKEPGLFGPMLDRQCLPEVRMDYDKHVAVRILPEFFDSALAPQIPNRR